MTPSGPGLATPVAARAGVQAGMAASAAGAGGPPSALRQIFGVFVDPAVYKALVYMILSLGTGIAYFTIVVTGANRELTGSFASVLYKLRPVEPYNMIGFRYSDQAVRRKAAKTTK